MNYRKAKNAFNILYAAGYFLFVVGGMAAIVLVVAKMFGMY